MPELSFVHDPTGGPPAAELFRVLTLGPVQCRSQVTIARKRL